MKPKIVMLVLFGLMLASVGIAYASTNGFSIDWWTVDGGGGTSQSSGSEYTLQGTTGQPDPGAYQGGDFSLEGGFWAGLRAWLEQFLIHLPIVLK